jgi:aminopeptidase N
MLKSIFLFFAVFTFVLADAQVCKPNFSYLYSKEKLFKKKTADNIDVIFQHLTITADPALVQMNGNVITHFKSKIAVLNQISFDLDDTMHIDSIVHHYQLAQFSHTNDLIQITLNKNVNLGETDAVTIYYHGDPTKSKNQGYFVEKHGRDSTLAPIIWTLSQPYGAQDWWPCKNTLDDKIDSLDFTIICPKGNRAASNGLLASIDSSSTSTISYTWQHRYPVVTYLVAFAITNYAEYTDTVRFSDGRTLPVLNYVYPELLANAQSLSPAIVPMMQLFDSLFSNYPFEQEKYGHAQFGRGGGMEHQTMSFMSSFDYDLMAHELAHQWFGDKITCNSWQDIWLNEGFATYLTALCYDFLKPDEWVNYIGKIKTDVLKKNDGAVFVADTNNIGRIFDGRLTYDKGAMVLHMLRFTLGDAVFFLALKNYINQSNLVYSFSSTNSFKSGLESQSGKDLNDFFAQWFYGEGYPIFTVRWKKNGTTQAIEISQQTSSPITNHFDISIPLLFKGDGFEKYALIEPNKQNSTYYIDLPGEATELSFDPYNQILAKGSVISAGSFDKNVKIFPNPAQFTVTLSSPNLAILAVELISPEGKTVLITTSFDDYSNIQEIDISNLSPGLYFYKCELSSGVGYGKLQIAVK